MSLVRADAGGVLVLGDRGELVRLGSTASLQATEAQGSLYLLEAKGSLATAGPALAGGTPTLLALHLSAGGTNYSATGVTWSVNGKVQLRCKRTSDGQPLAVSDWSPEGQGPVTLTGTGLTIGTEYRLQYYLDAIPDFAGYTEEWLDTNLVWTQPDKQSPFEGDFEA